MMQQENLMERITAREVIYDGSVVHLEKWKVELPDGREALREAVLHVGAVAIVAVDDQGRIAMVRQHRVVVGRVMMELPAGKLDQKGEDPLEAAKRELREETGLTAKVWTHMTDVITTPGFCDEQIALYLATDLVEGETDLDDDEFLCASRIPAQELFDMIYNKEICDGKTVCALLMAKPWIEKIAQ